MNRLAKFYDGRVAPDSRNDFLTQVGHTLRGKPISQQQFDLMVAQLSSMLDLGPEDRLLELGCGNRIITQHLAHHARSVVGVDFSAALFGSLVLDRSAYSELVNRTGSQDTEFFPAYRRPGTSFYWRPDLTISSKGREAGLDP